MTSIHFQTDIEIHELHRQTMYLLMVNKEKEWNILFNDALNTFLTVDGKCFKNYSSRSSFRYHHIVLQKAGQYLVNKRTRKKKV